MLDNDRQTTLQQTPEFIRFSSSALSMLVVGCMLTFMAVTTGIAPYVMFDSAFRFDGKGFLSEFTLFALPLLAAGIALIISAWIRGRRARLYRRYLSVIENANHGSLDDMAGFMGLDRDLVAADVQRMIEADLLLGYYLDEQQGRLVAPHEEAKGGSSPQRTMAAKCANCGASTLLRDGQVARCEYCGSPL
jgi:ABC-type cobalamin transport system permease subunit